MGLTVGRLLSATSGKLGCVAACGAVERAFSAVVACLSAGAMVRRAIDFLNGQVCAGHRESAPVHGARVPRPNCLFTITERLNLNEIVGVLTDAAAN